MHFRYMMERKDDAEEVTSFLKLPVYTREGRFIGNVQNVFIDMDQKRVSSLLVTNTNPSIVEGQVDVAVPYRWVNAVGDIILLSYFPDRITTTKKEEKPPEEDTDIDVIE